MKNKEKRDEQNLGLLLFFLVITRTRYLGFGPDLTGIFPRSLPQLSKQLRDQYNSQKTIKNQENRNQKTMFLNVLTKFHGSRPFQLPEYTVLHQESDFQVENSNFGQLDRKIQEKRDDYYQVLGFSIITRTGSLGFRRDLVGIFPRSLPQLSKQLRDQNHSQKHRKKNKI